MVRPLSLSAVLVALASSGCGTEQGPCTDGCPVLSGVYAIQNTTPVGDCGFSPYLLGPTVQLLQSDDGRRATFNVIDPSTQLEVPLVGEVYAPGPKDDPALIGSFRLRARTARAASRSDERTLTLDVNASGAVSLHEGRRMLSATLSTLDPNSQESCTVTISITGDGD